MKKGDIKYARSGNLNIAYQVVGEGAECIILIPGWVSNIEGSYELPGFAEFLSVLSIHRRVVLFDKRGTGLSDRVNEDNLPNLAVRIDDLNAIMQQEGIERAIFMGVSEGGPMALLFAATFPEKVQSLIIIGSYAHWIKTRDNPDGIPIEKHERAISQIDERWGQGFGFKHFAPAWADDPARQRIWASYLRKSASPNTAKALYRMNLLIDVRRILSEIKQPCLVIHRKNDRIIPVGLGRYLARHIKGAEMAELPGADHLFWIDPDVAIRCINRFLGVAPVALPDTSIKTVTLVRGVMPSGITHILTEAEAFVTNDSFTLSIFRSPNAGFEAAKTITSISAEATILLHTGVVRIENDEITGPAAEVLQFSSDRLHEHGIWVSEVYEQFLADSLTNWSGFRSISMGNTETTVNWYLWDQSSRSERAAGYLHLRDEKLKSADIEALTDLKEYLDSHFLDNFTLRLLSFRFGLNNFKLKYGFRKLFGTSVKQHQNNLRLEFARQLLRETELPIQEIARRVGYRQPASFSRKYLSKFGMNPKDERG